MSTSPLQATTTTTLSPVDLVRRVMPDAAARVQANLEQPHLPEMLCIVLTQVRQAALQDDEVLKVVSEIERYITSRLPEGQDLSTFKRAVEKKLANRVTVARQIQTERAQFQETYESLNRAAQATLGTTRDEVDAAGERLYLSTADQEALDGEDKTLREQIATIQADIQEVL